MIIPQREHIWHRHDINDRTHSVQKQNETNMAFYEVEKIIQSVKKPNVLFRVRWLGYGPEHDTWEPWSNLSVELKRLWTKDGNRRMVQRFTKSWTTIRCNRFSNLLIFFDEKDNAMLRFSPVTSEATFVCGHLSYKCKVDREGSFVAVTEPQKWPYLLVEFDLQNYYGPGAGIGQTSNDL